jgi:uncharacterized membrane protein (TIGR02234 family)
MTGRRGLLIAIVGSAVAGALILIASGRTWGSTVQIAETGRRVPATVSGSAAEPSLPALGIALLVLVGAVIAARSWLRRVVGALVVMTGGAAIAVAVAARTDVASELRTRAFGVAHVTVQPTTSGWAVLTLCAGVLAVVVGAVTMIIGPRWPALGSRYDAPTPRRSADGDGSSWEALDRGEDPTV